jgi:hypothetical protein
MKDLMKGYSKESGLSKNEYKYEVVIELMKATPTIESIGMLKRFILDEAGAFLSQEFILLEFAKWYNEKYLYPSDDPIEIEQIQEYLNQLK